MACAPLMPSGWLWETEAVVRANSIASSSVLAYNPTGLTLMAEPLPKLLYGCGLSVVSHLANCFP